jgi:hypothetical protein
MKSLLLFLFAASLQYSSLLVVAKSGPPACALKSFIGDNRKLFVLYCDTRLSRQMRHYKNESGAFRFEQTSRHSVEILNICRKAVWEGVGTKPKQYLMFLRHMISQMRRRGISENDIHVMLADSDTFWSTDSVSSVFRKYDCVRQNKSLVMSTESSCWVGRICTKEDIKHYYGHASSPSYSSFINSGLSMGSPSALVHLLEYVVSSNASLINGLLEDQRGYASYFAAYPSLVALDYHQELFGSLALAVKVNDDNTVSLTCEKSIEAEMRAQTAFLHKLDCDGLDSTILPLRKFHVQNTNCSIVRYRNPARYKVEYPYAFNCADLSKEIYSKGGFYLDQALCAIMRRPFRSLSGGNRYDRAVQEVFDTLASDPVLWHGNGFSKSTLISLKTELSQCLAAQ